MFDRRFKGLGEMMLAQLKPTTMLPETQTLTSVSAEEREASIEVVTGRKPQPRLSLTQANAAFAADDLDL